MMSNLEPDNVLSEPIPIASSGGRFASTVIAITGVSALIASLLTFGATWLQLKHYSKPLLQRYVVRILVLVPIFAAASWMSLVSPFVSDLITPVRDIYEAFTIYTFFQLLLNYIGGERELISRMYGRAPVPHPWPFSYFFEKVDISDTYTFLAIKRGILHYVWIKPVLALATVIMRATGTYKEGYIGISSGYFWSGLIYNVSISVCLYALGLFWKCMSDELKPYRPVPKFLCVKGILFASYWQGLLLSILVLVHAFPDNISGYKPDTLAAAIQDALLCAEMPFFALMHWYAFSWHDYYTPSYYLGRMPIKYAIRDSFGCVDLIQDTLNSLNRKRYEYRIFDSADTGMPHTESVLLYKQQQHGLRFSRDEDGNTTKYWVPVPSDDARAPLLQSSWSRDCAGEGRSSGYGTNAATEEPTLDPELEDLYTEAAQLEFGDSNCPIIPVHPGKFTYARRQQRDVECLPVRKIGSRGQKKGKKTDRPFSGPSAGSKQGSSTPQRVRRDSVSQAGSAGTPPSLPSRSKNPHKSVASHASSSRQAAAPSNADVPPFVPSFSSTPDITSTAPERAAKSSILAPDLPPDEVVNPWRE